MELPAVSTKYQEVLESIWNGTRGERALGVATTEYASIASEIVELIPQCIQKNESCLSNLEKSELEACSLSDLLICHYLSRLLEIDPEEINSMRFLKKKKTKVQEGDNFSAIAKVGRMRSRGMTRSLCCLESTCFGFGQR